MSSFDYTLDRREAILERLVVLGQQMSGIAAVHRNFGPTETGILGVPRPAFLLYDGGAKLIQDVASHKIQRLMPTTWEMSPQIVILLAGRDTVANEYLEGNYVPVGPEISQWKNQVDSVVMNDNQILDLVTANGGHWLTAIETDLKVGRTVGAYGAWLLMLYTFRYPLFPPR